MKLVEEMGMNGEGVSEIVEKRDVHFFGNIALQFQEDMTLAEVEEASKHLAYMNSPIVLEMAFDNAAILM